MFNPQIIPFRSRLFIKEDNEERTKLLRGGYVLHFMNGKLNYHFRKIMCFRMSQLYQFQYFIQVIFLDFLQI